MSYVFDGHDGNYCRAFVDSLRTLRDKGREISPRGQKTLELDHIVFKVDPKKSLYTSPKRNLNFYFLVAENLWYWSGRNSTELPSHYVKNYRDFSDDGIHQGSYSPQILEQIRYIINTLNEDHSTRQATMTLWRPNPSRSKDTPCTLSFDFKIRDGKLNMHTTMRSNDALWGNNYDIPSFSMLQIAIAGILGVETGLLYLTAHSYHIYEKHFDLMDELIKEEWNYSEYPKELEFPKSHCISLERHMGYIEDLLSAHYILKDGGNFDWDTGVKFYDQFLIMMELFHNKNNTELIQNLVDIDSPFGTIYNERNINKK